MLYLPQVQFAASYIFGQLQQEQQEQQEQQAQEALGRCQALGDIYEILPGLLVPGEENLRLFIKTKDKEI